MAVQKEFKSIKVYVLLSIQKKKQPIKNIANVKYYLAIAVWLSINFFWMSL